MYTKTQAMPAESSSLDEYICQNIWRLMYNETVLSMGWITTSASVVDCLLWQQKHQHLFVEHGNIPTLASVTMRLHSCCRRNHAACHAAKHLVCHVENARTVLQLVEMASAAEPSKIDTEGLVKIREVSRTLYHAA